MQIIIKTQIACFYIVTCYNQISKNFSKVYFQICGIDHRLIKSLNNALSCLNLRKNVSGKFSAILYCNNIRLIEYKNDWTRTWMECTIKPLTLPLNQLLAELNWSWNWLLEQENEFEDLKACDWQAFTKSIDWLNQNHLNLWSELSMDFF